MNALKRRKIQIALALAVAAVSIGIFGYCQTREKQDTRFETATVERGRIVAKVTATGTLSALVTVQVGSQVTGRLQEILVDFNSPVKKGEVIARIDPRLFQAAVDQARANLVAAEGKLTNAKVNSIDAARRYQRSQRLAERRLIAQADLDTAQASADSAVAGVEAARGEVEQARAGLNQAELNLAYTTIVSPINGVVISRNVDVGQTVAASLQAPTLFLIAEDLRKMQVDTSVAEADVGKLRPGMAARFTVDAYPSEWFEGTVRQIRNAAQTVQNVVTYNAVIDLDNLDFRLKPGMTANVTFIYAEREGTVRVPQAALRFRPAADLLARMNSGPGGALRSQQVGGPGSAEGPVSQGSRKDQASDMRTVWVLRKGNPEPIQIRVGISDGTATEMVEGDLREGDLVITDASGAEGKPTKPGGGPGAFRRIF